MRAWVLLVGVLLTRVAWLEATDAEEAPSDFAMQPTLESNNKDACVVRETIRTWEVTITDSGSLSLGFLAFRGVLAFTSRMNPMEKVRELISSITFELSSSVQLVLTMSRTVLIIKSDAGYDKLFHGDPDEDLHWELSGDGSMHIVNGKDVKAHFDAMPIEYKRNHITPFTLRWSGIPTGFVLIFDKNNVVMDAANLPPPPTPVTCPEPETPPPTVATSAPHEETESAGLPLFMAAGAGAGVVLGLIVICVFTAVSTVRARRKMRSDTANSTDLGAPSVDSLPVSSSQPLPLSSEQLPSREVV